MTAKLQPTRIKDFQRWEPSGGIPPKAAVAADARFRAPVRPVVGAAKLPPARISYELLRRYAQTDVAITPENLPVLNAFNEFLNLERRAGRRRFRLAVLCFGLVLAVLLAVGLWIGRSMVDQLYGALGAERERAAGERQHLGSELSGIAEATGALREQLALRDRALGSTRATLARHVDGQSNAVERIHATVAALERELTLLENRIGELTRPPETVATVLPSELDAQIAEDFALLRSFAWVPRSGFARESEPDRLPSVDSRSEDMALPSDVALPPSDALSIEIPEGSVVPWRLGPARRD